LPGPFARGKPDGGSDEGETGLDFPTTAFRKSPFLCSTGADEAAVLRRLENLIFRSWDRQ